MSGAQGPVAAIPHGYLFGTGPISACSERAHPVQGQPTASADRRQEGAADHPHLFRRNHCRHAAPQPVDSACGCGCRYAVRWRSRGTCTGGAYGSVCRQPKATWVELCVRVLTPSSLPVFFAVGPDMLQGVKELVDLPYALQKDLLREMGQQASAGTSDCNPFGGPEACVPIDPSAKFKKTCPEYLGKKVDCIYDLTSKEGPCGLRPCIRSVQDQQRGML